MDAISQQNKQKNLLSINGVDIEIKKLDGRPHQAGDQYVPNRIFGCHGAHRCVHNDPLSHPISMRRGRVAPSCAASIEGGIGPISSPVFERRNVRIWNDKGTALMP